MSRGFTCCQPWCGRSPLGERRRSCGSDTPRTRGGHRLTHDHLSAISGITAAGKLYMKVQKQALASDDVVRFLKHLSRHIPGEFIVIWDGAPIHRGKPVKDFLANGGGERIHLEQLPGYAPELNADEGIWQQLKGVELKNVRCNHLLELRYELRKAKERLRRRTDVIRGCIRQPGYIL